MRNAAEAISVVCEMVSFVLITPEFLSEATLADVQRKLDRIGDTRFVETFRADTKQSLAIIGIVFGLVAIYLTNVLSGLPDYAKQNLGSFLAYPVDAYTR
jgi:hypothetical protein